MPITQEQRILDLLLAGHPMADIAALMAVDESVVAAAAQDLSGTPSGQLGSFSASALNVGGTTIDGAGNTDVNGTLGVDGVATFDGAVAVLGEAEVASLEVDGGAGFFGTEPPGAAPAITGALSTVADAAAKAVLTSIIAVHTGNGSATNGTT